MLRPLLEASDYYLNEMPSCGVPYWDTGAPGLVRLNPAYRCYAADPFNDFEPVDSLAAAIAAQGLFRLGHHLGRHNLSSRFWRGGRKIAQTLLSDLHLRAGEKLTYLPGWPVVTFA